MKSKAYKYLTLQNLAGSTAFCSEAMSGHFVDVDVDIKRGLEPYSDCRRSSSSRSIIFNPAHDKYRVQKKRHENDKNRSFQLKEGKELKLNITFLIHRITMTLLLDLQIQNSLVSRLVLTFALILG
jgi:hypothetical protein